MALVTAVLVILIAYILVVIIRWALNRREQLSLLKRYGIPGPEPLFLTGNIYELKSQPTSNDLITSWIQQYGNVFGYYIGGVPYVVVNDLEMLKQMFIKDFHVFSNRPKMLLEIKPLKDTVAFLKDKRWKDVRSVLTPHFSSGKIKLLTQIVNKKVDITVDIVTKKAENAEMFDIFELMEALTLDVIAACALAMPTNCQENSKDSFLLAARGFFKFAYNRTVYVTIMFPFVASVMSFISNYTKLGEMTCLIADSVKSALEIRRKNPEMKSIDMLQLMLDHQKQDDGAEVITDEEIIDNAHVFLLAGYETTASALGFTFYLLIKHPEIQERIYEEIEDVEDVDYTSIRNFQYLDQVFSEALRIYPPVTGFVSRACAQDHQVGSHTIPKGAAVLAPVWDIHHNPDYWPDPWMFDPDRFSAENKASINNMAYLPFGIGRRNCIGARFAQLEVKLTLFRLIKAFRFEMCEKTDDPLTLKCPTAIINPAKGVYLRAIPRSQKL